MITNLIIAAIFVTLNFILGLLPGFSGLPTPIASAVSTMSGYWQSANSIFPMDTVVLVIAAALAETGTRIIANMKSTTVSNVPVNLVPCFMF